MLMILNLNQDIYNTPSGLMEHQKMSWKECEMENRKKSNNTIFAILNSWQWALFALRHLMVSYGWRGGELVEP